MVILLKLTYRFSAILIKIPAGFFIETDKLILKFTWKHKGPKISKITLKKNKTKDLYYQLLSNYKATVIKSVIRISIRGQWTKLKV